MTTTLRPIVPLDYPALIAKLRLRGSCVITEYRRSDPTPIQVARPATCTKGALTIVLTETVGPYTDSPPRPILTLTHRASGHLVPGAGGWWWPGTAKGLRLARRALRAVVAATKGAVDWAAVDPFPAELGLEARKLAVAAMRASVAAALEAAEQKA